MLAMGGLSTPPDRTPFITITLAPAINFEVTWFIKYNEKTNELKVKVKGSHNEFPAFEALVDGKVLYGDDDISSGPGLGNLGVFWDDYEAGYKTFD
jgi:hypothetical protein